MMVTSSRYALLVTQRAQSAHICSGDSTYSTYLVVRLVVLQGATNSLALHVPPSRGTRILYPFCSASHFTCLSLVLEPGLQVRQGPKSPTKTGNWNALYCRVPDVAILLAFALSICTARTAEHTCAAHTARRITARRSTVPEPASAAGPIIVSVAWPVVPLPHLALPGHAYWPSA